MRIGELGERAGVPPKTIRYYEGINLLLPPDRTPGGYRDYGEGDLERLRFIKAAQSVGFTLGEIREVLGFRDRGQLPCQHVGALIKRHAADVAERIRALEKMRDDLDLLDRRAQMMPPQRDAAYCHIIEGLIAPSPEAERNGNGQVESNGNGRGGAMPQVQRCDSVAPTADELDARFRGEGLEPKTWSNGPGDRYGWHEHSYHKVLYCLSGSIDFHTPDGDLSLRAGDRLDLEPGIRHAATVGPDGVRCMEAAREG